MLLPRKINIPQVPPIKIQGIKTKLVPFITESVKWDGEGTYFEPFMGSGVVGFNIAPQRAVFSDTNPYIIQFYKDVQDGTITPHIVHEYLKEEGYKLSQTPNDKTSYYYEVRNRFNKTHSSLDFLFLQRSNFNGMIRFNSKGEYNVPFGRKPQRFQQALITKICNQVKWVQETMKNKEWDFLCVSFEEIFEMVEEGDFIYLDPPYINRHDGYYDSWNEELANQLAYLAQHCDAGYAFSMWYENKYRKNDHILEWDKGVLLTTEHFYHVGAKEANRNKMIEALIVSEKNVNYQEVREPFEQLALL
ncbi:DNA adenine methylase [Suicoccus acidiformans]|uniref:Site-specific DNA-methyltransferase (adenine-specific) n=1 Tax=Suicoccus acidiformans TaxID=2036206 RepID=A0A347WMN1_9LACT|nr:Dam family site-specific DNA-(adenine-N6)-methyltransferase [Suicoccus acidiformans]AXY26338.1 DNA adenine methylase [Suicoccus acidiformans]